MIWLALAVSLGLFVWSLRWSRAMETAGSAMQIARTAMSKLVDAKLSDDEKERAARESSGRLFVLGLAIAGRLILALAIPAAFLGVLVVTRVVGITALVDALESWTFLIASAVAIGAAMYLMK